MALMDAGYYQTTYFSSSYFPTGPQYFPEYGAVSPPEPTGEPTGGPAQTKKQFPLQLGLTMEGELVWVIPIPLRKQN